MARTRKKKRSKSQRQQGDKRKKDFRRSERVVTNKQTKPKKKNAHKPNRRRRTVRLAAVREPKSTTRSRFPHKRARRPDRRRRRMKLPARRGFQPITVRGSRQASLLGRYTSAVGHFLKSGEVDRLRDFEGRKLNKRPLITDPEILTELAHAGELQLDELYVHPGPSR